MTDFGWIMLVIAVAMVCGTAVYVALIIASGLEDKRRWDAFARGLGPKPMESPDA